jgi:hypothetical protein
MTKSKKKATTKDKSVNQRGWMTDEQFDYLSSHLPAFINAQSSKTTADGWAVIHEEWFKRWPLGPPTEKDVKVGRTEAQRLTAMKTVNNYIS